jgi:organic hydroperoxide reductase OsmC/OhrA
MKRKASAVWEGGLENGKGRLSTDSGVLSNTQYSFSTRFEDGIGTIRTTATLTMEKLEAGCPVSRVLNAKITMDARLEA